MGDPQAGHGSVPVGGPKTNPVRLVVLLALLAVLVGALGFDQFVAKKGVEAADQTLKVAIAKHNAIGFDPKLTIEEKKEKIAHSLLSSADVQKILNKSPASTSTGDNGHGDTYTIEIYRWWGYIPLNRHYISVVYRGIGSSAHYSTHFVNTTPPPDSLPGYERSLVGYEPPAGASEAGKKSVPGGKGGGKGKGKGGMKGKGGGPPGGGAPGDSPAGATEATPPAEEKSDAKDSAKKEDKPAETKPGEEKPAVDKPAAKSNESASDKSDKKDAEPKKEEEAKPATEKKEDKKEDK